MGGEESSDEEVGSESHLYEKYLQESNCTPHGILTPRTRTHSMSSGSSGGDVTPCNAVSPGLVGRPLSTIFRNPNEDVWRQSVTGLLRCSPNIQPMLLVHRLNTLLKVFYLSFKELFVNMFYLEIANESYYSLGFYIRWGLLSLILQQAVQYFRGQGAIIVE